MGGLFAVETTKCPALFLPSFGKVGREVRMLGASPGFSPPSSPLWGRSIAPPPRRGSEPIWFFAWSVAEPKKPNAPKTPDMPLGPRNAFGWCGRGMAAYRNSAPRRARTQGACGAAKAKGAARTLRQRRRGSPRPYRSDRSKDVGWKPAPQKTDEYGAPGREQSRPNPLLLRQARGSATYKGGWSV
jgi:hypothetical protein